MTTFTINDAIFSPLRDAPGADPAALQNFVDALNQNAYANATFTQAVQRGDVVFELVDHAEMEKVGAGALFSNDRGTKEFLDRQDKFAIQLDKDWFVPNGSDGATLSHPQAVVSALGMVTHEADHSNTQALFDEAFKISSTTPDTYRPDLIGVARVAAAVDLTMKAEVAGWYADLQTLRTELDDGRISQVRFDALTTDNTAGRLLAVEAEGKALGLSGDALTDYVTDHGKGLLPSGYIERYTASYAPGTDPQEVRAHLAYALNDPNGIYSFTEEVGPDGTYIATATYNNGDTRTTVDTGLSCRVTQTEAVFHSSTSTTYDAEGRTIQSDFEFGNLPQLFVDIDLMSTHYDDQGRIDSSYTRMGDGSAYSFTYDVDGSQPWSSTYSLYDTQGHLQRTEVTMDDGSHGLYEYGVYGDGSVTYTHLDAQMRSDLYEVTQSDGSRQVLHYDPTNTSDFSFIEEHYDTQARHDSTSVHFRDGALSVTEWDVNNVQSWAAISKHYDGLSRNDATNVWMADGSYDVLKYDVNNSQAWSFIDSHFDALSREDYAYVQQNDGSHYTVDYDQDGTHDWSSVVTNYSASGQRTTQTTYFDNGERAERTYFPDQHPEAFSEQYFYADGHGAGGKVQFDGYSTRLFIGGSDMAGEFVGSVRDAWASIGVYYNDSYSDAPQLGDVIELPYPINPVYPDHAYPG